MRMGAWVGLLGPKGMPPELVAKIHAATERALQSPRSRAGSARWRQNRCRCLRSEFGKLISDEIAENKELLAEVLAAEKK